MSKAIFKLLDEVADTRHPGVRFRFSRWAPRSKATSKWVAIAKIPGQAGEYFIPEEYLRKRRRQRYSTATARLRRAKKLAEANGVPIKEVLAILAESDA